MKKLLFASVGLAAMATAATAADLPAAYPTKAPAYVAQVYNWTGFYIGGNLGYGWARTSGTVTLTGPAFGTVTGSGTGDNLGGLVGGAQIGYNWQVSQFVFGVEADINASGQDRGVTLACGVGCSITESERVRWFGTLRARAGLAADRWLFYVTGGFVWQDYNDTVTINTTAPVTTTAIGIGGNSKTGWTIGAGVEAALWGNWTGGLEYLYMRTDSDTRTVALPAAFFGAGATATTSGRLENNVVRAKLNYRF